MVPHETQKTCIHDVTTEITIELIYDLAKVSSQLIKQRQTVLRRNENSHVWYYMTIMTYLFFQLTVDDIYIDDGMECSVLPEEVCMFCP